MWTFTKRAFMSAVVYDPTQDRDKDSPFRKIAPGRKIKTMERFSALPVGSQVAVGRASYRKADDGAWYQHKYSQTGYTDAGFVGHVAEGNVRQIGTHILVRARVKEDLEDLRTVVPNVTIDDQAAADYRFRAVIPRSKWKKYLCEQVDDMDYDSHFKEVVRDNATQPGARYSAMMGVWSDMAQLQPSSYSGFKHTGKYGTSYYSGYGTSGKASGGGARPETKPFSTPGTGTGGSNDKGVDTRQGTVEDGWGEGAWDNYDDKLGYALSVFDSDSAADRDADSDVIDFEAFKRLILTRLGALELLPDEESRTDDFAYEVYLGLIEEHGLGTRIFEADIDAAEKQVREDRLDVEALEELAQEQEDGGEPVVNIREALDAFQNGKDV